MDFSCNACSWICRPLSWRHTTNDDVIPCWRKLRIGSSLRGSAPVDTVTSSSAYCQSSRRKRSALCLTVVRFIDEPHLTSNQLVQSRVVLSANKNASCCSKAAHSSLIFFSVGHRSGRKLYVFDPQFRQHFCTLTLKVHAINSAVASSYFILPFSFVPPLNTWLADSHTHSFIAKFWVASVLNQFQSVHFSLYMRVFICGSELVIPKHFHPWQSVIFFSDLPLPARSFHCSLFLLPGLFPVLRTHEFLGLSSPVDSSGSPSAVRMSASDRRFRRAVGRVLIALSFKHSREHGRGRAVDGRLRSPNCDGHRPGGYPSSPTDRQTSTSPSSQYCTVVRPSPTHFFVRTFRPFAVF